MNLNESIENTASVKCPSCANLAFDSEVVCSQCNYPLKGTEQDQKDFLFDQDMRSIDVDTADKQLKKARNMLYYIAVIYILTGIITYAKNQHLPGASVGLGLDMLLSLFFIILAVLTTKRPTLCIITGLTVFTIVIIANAIVNPLTLIQGIVMKIAAYILLFNGLKSAREAEKIRSQYPLL
ncbi:MAG: hypothetical protein ACTHMI_22755 [Mucilaginibacter sp.]|jgi:hypothetical protein